ncbi:MAG: lipid-A-disaccharide synthase [Candidatus Omnitrophota bacterium]|nr:lipid-A-disaccharide synthase [Candidatus Omnitrophota bacterium]
MEQVSSKIKTQKSKHVFIVCGEPSGDLNAGLLAEALKKLNPDIKISGVGGALLQKSGAEIFYDIAGLSVMGLFDVLKKLPKFFALKKLILEKISSEKPDAIILVDFSGFNLRLAKTINKKIPVIYYVSPQVWASRKGRVETIKKYISKMIVIFKFEEEFYKKYGIDAEFVGHPLLDIVKPAQEKNEFLKQCGFSENKTTIALLPGSRAAEIKNILPVMAKTAELISEKLKNAQFVIARSPNVELNIYKEIIDGFKINITIIEGRTYDCLNIADFALVCSGTATLETAIMQKPFVIIYKMNLLNYLLYRPQVKLPYIGMVNIVAGKKIIPEFIQFGAKPEIIAEAVLGILRDETKLSQMKKNLSEISSLLGPSNAATSAAKIILNIIS